MSDNNGPAFKRKQVAKIINDVLAKIEKHGEIARNKMVRELDALKKTIQKYGADSTHADAETRKKIYWLLGELEKKLNGPAHNFAARDALKGASIRKQTPSSQTPSGKNGE